VSKTRSYVEMYFKTLTHPHTFIKITQQKCVNKTIRANQTPVEALHMLNLQEFREGEHVTISQTVISRFIVR